MQHLSEHALLETAREAALKRGDVDRRRATGPGVVIFLQEQQVDLPGRAAQRRLLQQQGKCPRLLEIGRQQHVGQPLGLAQVVGQVGQEFLPVLPEGVLDLRPVNVGAALARLGRDAEVDRHVLEPVGGHLPRRDVVELHQQVGVDHRPARDVAAGKIDPPLRHLHPAVAKPGRQAEPAPGARHLQPLRALPQKIKVKLEDVVPLDDVGIQLAQQVVEREQQPLFPRLALLPQRQQLPPRAALQPDGEHAVPGVARVAEGPGLRRAGLDVELAAPQAGERQVGEKPRPLLQQPLALVGLEHIHRGPLTHTLEEHLEGRQRLRMGQPVEAALALQPLQLHAVKFAGAAQPGKGPESLRALFPPPRGGGHAGVHGPGIVDPETAQRFTHGATAALRTAGKKP